MTVNGFSKILSSMLQFGQKRNGYVAALETHQNFLNCKQANPGSICRRIPRDSNIAADDTIEYHEGTFVENYMLAAAMGLVDGILWTESKRRRARDETLAMAIICGVDPTRYGTLIAELTNHYAFGRNDNPTNFNAAYGLLVNYHRPTDASRPRNNNTPVALHPPAPRKAISLPPALKTVRGR